MTTTAGLDPVAAINAVTSAAPKLDPKTTVTVARTSQSAPEAVAKAQATFHFGNTVRAYDALKGMSAHAQSMAWDGLTAPEQASLHTLGYRPPNLAALRHVGAGGDHGSIWAKFATGVSDALHDSGQALGRATGDTLNALGSPLRAVQHAVRATHVVSEMGVTAHTGERTAEQDASRGGLDLTAGWSDIFSPADWAKAWRETTNGTTSLDPAARRALIRQHGAAQVNLALRVATQGPQAVVSSAPAKSRVALTKQLQDPRFNQLVNDVRNSRISIGRSAVGTKFFHDHPEAANVISGGLDAAFDVLGTPTLMAGKVVKGVDAAKWGITGADAAAHVAGNASRVDDLMRTAGFTRWTDRVGNYLAHGDGGAISRFDPRLVNMLPEWSRAGVDSPERLRTWFSEQGGIQAMIEGRAARSAHGLTMIPHLTPVGWAKASTKAVLHAPLDRLADLGMGPKNEPLAREAADTHLGPGEVSSTGLTHQAWQTHKVATLASAMEVGSLAGSPGRIARIANVARIVRRLSTLVPTTNAIDIGEKPDVENFRRFVQGFLSSHATDTLTNLFAGGSVATRRNLVRAARMQMLEAAGAYKTPELRDATDKFLAMLEDSEDAQRYAPNDIDAMLGEHGLLRHTAILENQLAHKVAIPSPRDVRRLVQQHSLLSALGVNPAAAVDRAMYWWRSLILDRPGFALRFSLTEGANRVLRGGVRKALGAQLANGARRTMDDGEIDKRVAAMLKSGEIGRGDVASTRAALRASSFKQLVPYHPAERLITVLAQRMPAGLRDKAESFADLYGGVMGPAVREFVRKTQAKGVKLLGLEHYITAARHLATHQPVTNAFDEYVSAAMGVGDEFLFSPAGVIKAMKNDAKGVTALMRTSNHWSVDDTTSPLYAFKWHVALDQLANSKLARAVLESIHEPKKVQTAAVERVLNDVDFASNKAAFERARELPDGRVVGVDATQKEADRAFARTVVRHVHALVRAGDPDTGEIMDDLVDEMLLNGSAPEQETLARAIADHRIPRQVFGPDMLEVHGRNAFFDKTFETLVGKPANWLARQPHFVQKYGDALPGARKLAAAMGSTGKDAEKLASDIAMHRAVNDILPFIHNPRLRTQFEDYHRVLMPFLFAQRQFLQRWARTFADSPDAIRKLQLTLNGLTTSGFVRRDTNGQDYFYYPGSQYVQELLTHALNGMGIHVSIPMVVPFTGELKYLIPGLANPITPSVGPFAAVGMKEIARLFPEMQSSTQTLLGQGASTPVWEQFTPSIFNRLYEALGPEQTGSQLASTTMQAIKYLDATGTTLPNDPTPAQQSAYVQRVTNWARILLVVRATMGFVAPATPTATLDPKGLDKRVRTLMGEMPYTQAITEYLREHPHATAYTVSQSENATDGSTPATAATLQWMNGHRTFIAAHPHAAAWFVPRTVKGTFTPAAYREQIAMGMRNPKPVWAPEGPQVDNFLDDVILGRSSTAYFTALDRYNAAYNSTTSSTDHQALVHEWHTFKASFFKQYPLFAQYVGSAAGHVKRMETIDDVTKALSDPSVPQTAQTQAMGTILDHYDQFQAQYTAVAGGTSSQTYDDKKALQNEMVAWGTAYATAHPAAADFWNVVVRPEVDEAT